MIFCDILGQTSIVRVIFGGRKGQEVENTMQSDDFLRYPGPDLHSESAFQRASMKAAGGDMVGAVVYIYRKQ